MIFKLPRYVCTYTHHNLRSEGNVHIEHFITMQILFKVGHNYFEILHQKIDLLESIFLVHVATLTRVCVVLFLFPPPGKKSHSFPEKFSSRQNGGSALPVLTLCWRAENGREEEQRFIVDFRFGRKREKVVSTCVRSLFSFPLGWRAAAGPLEIQNRRGEKKVSINAFETWQNRQKSRLFYVLKKAMSSLFLTKNSSPSAVFFPESLWR